MPKRKPVHQEAALDALLIILNSAPMFRDGERQLLEWRRGVARRALELQNDIIAAKPASAERLKRLRSHAAAMLEAAADRERLPSVAAPPFCQFSNSAALELALLIDLRRLRCCPCGRFFEMIHMSRWHCSEKCYETYRPARRARIAPAPIRLKLVPTKKP